jgi:hypothetical protein
MNHDTYQIIRAGQTIGNYPLWEIRQRLATDQLAFTDEYVRTGSAEKGRLIDLKEAILASSRPEAAAPMSHRGAASGQEVSFYGPLVGSLVGIAGIVVLAIGLFSSPDGSAIRQQVLVQYMTNGILLMILGVLLAKR